MAVMMIKSDQNAHSLRNLLDLQVLSPQLSLSVASPPFQFGSVWSRLGRGHYRPVGDSVRDELSHRNSM